MLQDLGAYTKAFDAKNGTNLDDAMVREGNLLEEFDATSTLTLVRSYTWGLDVTGSLTAAGGVGGLLQIYDYTATKTYLPTYDGNGNVVSLLNADPTSGAVAAIYEYGPAGEPIRAETIDSNLADQPFRFSTKFTDTETGLVYYGNRYYSATLGRFINRDPIEEQGGLNLYGFVSNDGINHWDLLGLIKQGCQTTYTDYPDGRIEVHTECSGFGDTTLPADMSNGEGDQNYGGSGPGLSQPVRPDPVAAVSNDSSEQDRKSLCQEFYNNIKAAAIKGTAARNRADQLINYLNRLNGKFANDGRDVNLTATTIGTFTDMADFGLGKILPVSPSKLFVSLFFRTNGIVTDGKEGNLLGGFANATLSLTSITLEYGEITRVAAEFGSKASGVAAFGALSISLYKGYAPYLNQESQRHTVTDIINGQILYSNRESVMWNQVEAINRNGFNENHCSDFY